MRNDPLSYDTMMEDALRGVVRRAIAIAAERGLPGDHHFYVTFRTDQPGVAIPDSLRRRYPKEMTIVIQHQFWGLAVDDAKFEVTLSFDSKHERLVIPLRAITAFVDPSVQFGLQFPGATTGDAAPAEPEAAPAASPAASEPAKDEKPAAPASGDGRVVALDAFRKK